MKIKVKEKKNQKKRNIKSRKILVSKHTITVASISIIIKDSELSQ